MGVFNDPRFFTWKTICEAKGFHIVVVETTQGEFIGGNINAAIEILGKKKKKLEVKSLDWLPEVPPSKFLQPLSSWSNHATTVRYSL